ncbi:hypothetical protein SLA2020_458140 [Shorea laevis]
MLSAVQKYPAKQWTALISCIAQGGADAIVALREASEFLNSGVKPDGFDLVHLVRVSTDMGYASYCQQLHGYVLKSGFVSNTFVSNALMRFYYKRMDSLSDAHKAFVEILQPSVVSWNSLISGYVKCGEFRRALGLFLELERSGICGDAYSFTAVLVASGQVNLLQLGKSMHSKIVKYGLECGSVVANCLIDMYGKCGSVEDATRVFDGMIDKDIVSWNSVIAACARNGELQQALSFWNQAPERDTITYNELISGIAQFGNIEDAIGVLSNMPNPNSSSWTSIVTGYVNRNRAREALEFFSKMHSNDIEMDEFTFSIILSGVAGLAALTWGMLIHCCTVKHGLDTSVVVGSALIDMYSKCGQINNAESMFWSLPKRNLITWNAMVSGYAHSGDLMKVIEYFEQLKMVKDLKPDSITFLNVLAACSHNEIPLQKAIQYLESMIKGYGIEPTIEHCCSMIRLMGQRGEVSRAEKMISELGFGSFGVVWKALLGACGACKDTMVAKIAAAKVIELGGADDYVYVMMSNIFAYHGKWKEMSLLRKFMRDKGVRKETGCSWIEVENAMSNTSI